MARKPPKPLYQLLFPLPQSCSHMVVAHDTPESEGDLFDNCTLLLSTITQLFNLLSLAAQGSSNQIITDSNQSIFDLGRDLCEELGRRVQLLSRSHEVLAEREEPAIALAQASTSGDEAQPPRAPDGQDGSPCQEREAPVPSAPRLRTSGVDLVDQAGRVRASLDLALNEEPGLRLFDRTGNELAAFCLDEEGHPTLFFSDSRRVRLCLDLYEDERSPGSPLKAAVCLTGADGFDRFALDVAADGTPSLVISDAARKETWRAPAQASTAPARPGNGKKS